MRHLCPPSGRAARRQPSQHRCSPRLPAPSSLPTSRSSCRRCSAVTCRCRSSRPRISRSAQLVGTYATQNFGASLVGGVRLGYHLSEDFFVEGVYGRTKVSDETFRQILPGGIFPQQEEKLTYYNVSVGYNVLPGEVFFGSKYAKASSLYLIGGVGSTKFADQRQQTFNVGFGFRVLFSDRWRDPARRARPHLPARPARQAREHAEPRADHRRSPTTSDARHEPRPEALRSRRNAAACLARPWPCAGPVCTVGTAAPRCPAATRPTSRCAPPRAATCACRSSAAAW